LEPQAEQAQLLDELAVRIVGEPLCNRLGAVRTDAFGFLDLLLRRGSETVDRLEVAREVLCGNPSDVRDVQAEEDTMERNILRRLDRLDRIRRRDLGVALDLHQLFLRQPVQLGQRADETEIPQTTDGLFTDA